MRAADTDDQSPAESAREQALGIDGAMYTHVDRVHTIASGCEVGTVKHLLAGDGCYKAGQGVRCSTVASGARTARGAALGRTVGDGRHRARVGREHVAGVTRAARGAALRRAIGDARIGGGDGGRVGTDASSVGRRVGGDGGRVGTDASGVGRRVGSDGGRVGTDASGVGRRVGGDGGRVSADAGRVGDRVGGDGGRVGADEAAVGGDGIGVVCGTGEAVGSQGSFNPRDIASVRRDKLIVSRCQTQAVVLEDLVDAVKAGLDVRLDGSQSATRCVTRNDQVGALRGAGGDTNQDVCIVQCVSALYRRK